MDVREKLVELIDNFHRDLSPFAGNEKLFVVDDNVEQAEYLIEHGVTVQEWISVKDRLPEQGEEAICIAADGDMMIGKYTEWGWLFPCYFEDLTHWMPLPPAPKGE